MLYSWTTRIQRILKQLVSFIGRCVFPFTCWLQYRSFKGLLFQAPEMRLGSYNALKVDVWSLGATTWEMAECNPPFIDMDVSDPRRLPKQWPPLSEQGRWSPAFVDFLDLCSKPERERPSPAFLLSVSLTLQITRSSDLTFHCLSHNLSLQLVRAHTLWTSSRNVETWSKVYITPRPLVARIPMGQFKFSRDRV